MGMGNALQAIQSQLIADIEKSKWCGFVLSVWFTTTHCRRSTWASQHAAHARCHEWHALFVYFVIVKRIGQWAKGYGRVALV
jgi:hypothetical protein